MGGLKIISINFCRIRNGSKILEILEKFEKYGIDIYCIQEIDVESAVKYLKNKYQIIINWDLSSKSKVGIVTLVKKGLILKDTIVGQNGRILGIKLQNCQIWNIYPPSGSEFRKAREIFFNDTM